MYSKSFLLCIPYNELISWHDDNIGLISNMCNPQDLVDIICLAALNNDLNDLSEYRELILTLLYRRSPGEYPDDLEYKFVNYVLSKVPVILKHLTKIPNYQDSFKSIIVEGLIYVFLKVDHGNAHMHV